MYTLTHTHRLFLHMSLAFCKFIVVNEMKVANEMHNFIGRKGHFKTLILTDTLALSLLAISAAFSIICLKRFLKS